MQGLSKFVSDLEVNFKNNMSIREIAQNFHNFCPLFEFSHCFCPKFVHCFCPNFGKSNGKFGQKQWEILGKSNEKTRKAADYFSGKNYCFFPNFPLLLPEFSFAFPRISYCFCPNFLLILAEFPTAFARIFVFKIFFFGGGGTVPPPRAFYACGINTKCFLCCISFIIH